MKDLSITSNMSPPQISFSAWKYRGITLLATITIGLAIAALVHYGLREDFTSGCFISAAAIIPFAFVGAGISIHHLITRTKTILLKPTDLLADIPSLNQRGVSSNASISIETPPPASPKEEISHEQKGPFVEPDFSVNATQELDQVVSLPSAVTLEEEYLCILSCLAEKASPPGLFKEPFPYVRPCSEDMISLWEECSRLQGEELYIKIATAFLENLSFLGVFLRKQTQAILLLQNPTKEDRERFGLLNKQVRMILLSLIFYEYDKSISVEDYKNFVNNFFGNRKVYCSNGFPLRFCFMRCRSFMDLKNWLEMDIFLWDFLIYRKHTLLRLFPEKVKMHMSSSCPEELWPLLSATWFHGTRATTSLKETDFTLIPGGELHQRGYTSFFGEMLQGCQKNGVNAHALSGTYLERVDWAINSYATQFQFNIQTEMDFVYKFLNTDFTIDEEIISEPISLKKFLKEKSFELPRVEVALRRWAQWDRSAFEREIESLHQELASATEAIDFIEGYRPKEIFNNDGDRYYSADYENLCHSINQMKVFLRKLPPPLTDEQKRNIQNNFPAVLGSFTLISRPTHYDDRSGEHLVEREVQLGTDVQLLCVQQKDLKRAEEWLQSSLPDSGIRLVSFDQLFEAQKFNQEISTYLADPFSVTKFQLLTKTNEIIE